MINHPGCLDECFFDIVSKRGKEAKMDQYTFM